MIIVLIALITAAISRGVFIEYRRIKHQKKIEKQYREYKAKVKSHANNN
jgi:hypothetical protein